MAPQDSAYDDWLAGEIAAVEQTLLGGGASCTLDRRRETAPALKRAEGRYALLRRARRARERGEGPQPLLDEAAKAQAFLGGAGPLAGDRQWLAYQEGVLAAANEALQRLDGESGAA